MKRIELLAPVGSMANLKAAVSRGADAVYLGMRRFSARDFATNFNEEYLKDAIKICKSNNVKAYLAMNTLVKNSEINEFFEQLNGAYSIGIDSVIIQEVSFIDMIKENFPDLNVHVSTQAGVMNSEHAKLFHNADRITLARELRKNEVREIRKNYDKELEIFGHGALCVCVSGQCLFSSFLGGRSGNRGKCAQPCRKKYNGKYLLSTKELCLIDELPSIIGMGVDSLKLEGRMRSPYYVASVVQTYRKAIDSYYNGDFDVDKGMIKKLESAFSREFTKGDFLGEEVFNREKATGISEKGNEFYETKVKDVDTLRDKKDVKIRKIEYIKSSGKELIVRVYSGEDAILAEKAGADIIYYDIMKDDFINVKEKIKGRLFGYLPRIMTDSDFVIIGNMVKIKKPDGIVAGNFGQVKMHENVYFDYNINCFNDYSLDYMSKYGVPVMSPELSIKEMLKFRNKDFIAFIHGKIRLMTLRHEINDGKIVDERKGEFIVEKIHNGIEIINSKELGLLNKSKQLLNNGVNKFYIDTDKDVGEVVKAYRDILDGRKIDDSKLKKKYVLGWAYRGVR